MSNQVTHQRGLLCPDCKEDCWGSADKNYSRQCLSHGGHCVKGCPNYYSHYYLTVFWEGVRSAAQLTYLAGPYSHADKDMEVFRFEILNQVAAKLMRQGKMVFSPISHSHPIALSSKLPTDWKFWKQFATSYLMCSKELYVTMLPGWKESVGVTAEIEFARNAKMRIYYIDENCYVQKTENVALPIDNG